MANCNLCKKKKADKKGSHVVPHFLLKRVENIDGKTGRDYEMGFKIESLNSSSHFGRAIQPERLKETYGEINDEDIKNNKHPLIVDYFLCSDCEERLSYIESKYSHTINTLEKIDYESGISTSLGVLFWVSIFWRMSVHGESGVKLVAEQNELLRVILDSCLPKVKEQLDEKLIEKSELVKKLSYKIIRCYNSEKGDAKWILFHPDFYNVLCLFIDEFVIVLSLNGHYDEFNVIDCFGINYLILDAPTNIIGTQEIIKPFDRTVFIELSKKFANKMKDVYIDSLFNFLDKVHIASGKNGDKMPIELKQKILIEITSDEKKIGRKYTQDELLKSTLKVIKNTIINQ